MMTRQLRLFHIVALLADGKVYRSEDIMAVTKTGERTTYRDIAALRAAGVNIKSEPGVGFLMRLR